MLRFFAKVDSPHVLPILSHLVSYPNYLNERALQAMQTRALDRPTELELIAAAVRQAQPKLATDALRSQASGILHMIHRVSNPRERKRNIWWVLSLLILSLVGLFMLLTWLERTSLGNRIVDGALVLSGATFLAISVWRWFASRLERRAFPVDWDALENNLKDVAVEPAVPRPG